MQEFVGGNMPYPQPAKCPVCSAELAVTRLHCHQCDTTIEGYFSAAAGPFDRLTAEQTQFLLAFVRCEGRLNRLEEELNLSYPTLRNRLGDVIRTLGFEPNRDETPVRISLDDRRRILDDLDQGRINAQEASQLLRGVKSDVGSDHAERK
ncbi:DUF2089 domain-containing protein [bacterium]|nr:DUF2089 domain-containing protein [bacterium]